MTHKPIPHCDHVRSQGVLPPDTVTAWALLLGLVLLGHAAAPRAGLAQASEPGGETKRPPQFEPLDSTETVRQHLGIPYAHYGDRTVHLDLFQPADDSETPRPALLVVHGGGWLKGDKTRFHPLAKALAARGYVTAAMEYRLGGEAKFPAAIHDCHAAVRWLRAHADDYGIDRRRIGAVGGSAGGHLVGLLAATAGVPALHGDGGSRDATSAIQAAIVMAGPLELATGPVADKSRKQPEQSNSNKWLGKTVDEAPELYRLASATSHLSAGTPPIMFLVGEMDDPPRNRAARQTLRGFEVPTGITVFKDGPHGCWNRSPWFEPMVDDMDQFFGAVFAMPDRLESAPFLKARWGELVRGRSRLELHIASLPANRTIAMPRLNNPIGPVYLKGDKARTPLGFRPEVADWLVTLPESLGDQAPVVVVETIGLPRIAGLPRIVSQSEDTTLRLAAHDAVVHGEKLRYEPQPHKNTVGYWSVTDDWCEWHCYVDQPGEFDVVIWQGCGKGHGGSQVAVMVGDEQLQFTVEDTGHFQNFQRREIGTVTRGEPGVFSVRLRAQTKAAGAVMDVRLMELIRR
jgi:acetyl esterase/lipase